MHVRGPMGRIMYLDPSDDRAHELLRAGGNHNPGALRIWRSLVERHDWDIVIDVGANYGEMLVNVNLPATATTIALEPNPYVVSYLARTLRESDQRIDLLPIAASDRSGISAFVADLKWSGQSGIESKTAGSRTQVIRVATTRLDHLVSLLHGNDADHDILVKIDVEGHETSVLAGTEGLATAGSVLACVVEITHMDGATLAGLGKTYDVYVQCTERDQFVPIEVRPDDVPTALASAHGAYPHDALLVGRTVGRKVLGL